MLLLIIFVALFLVAREYDKPIWTPLAMLALSLVGAVVNMGEWVGIGFGILAGGTLAILHADILRARRRRG